MVETVYIGTDKATRRRLLVQGQPMSADDLAAISEIRVCVGDVVLLESNNEVARDGDVIVFRLGDRLERGRHTARITLYDAQHPNGIPWGEFLVQAIVWSCI